MASESTSSTRLDQIRAENPELGFAIYAYTPGGIVTLEIHTPEKEIYTFGGLSETDVLNQAFPVLPDEKPAPASPKQVDDIFD